VHAEAARAALAQHRAAKFAHHPPADPVLMMASSRVFELADTPMPRSAIILTQAGTDRYTGIHRRATTRARRRRGRTECWPGQEPLPHRRSSLQGSDILILRMESQWHQRKGAGTKRGRISTRPLGRDQSIVRARCSSKRWGRRRQGGGQWAPNMGWSFPPLRPGKQDITRAGRQQLLRHASE